MKGWVVVGDQGNVHNEDVGVGRGSLGRVQAGHAQSSMSPTLYEPELLVHTCYPVPWVVEDEGSG